LPAGNRAIFSRSHILPLPARKASTPSLVSFSLRLDLLGAFHLVWLPLKNKLKNDSILFIYPQ